MLSIRIQNNAGQSNTIVMPKNATISAAIEESGVYVGSSKFYINSKPFDLFGCGLDATFESIGFNDGENVTIVAVKETNNAR